MQVLQRNCMCFIILVNSSVETAVRGIKVEETSVERAIA